MGLFDSVFGKRTEQLKDEKKLSWIPLVSVKQLNGIAERSATRTQLIFKHSTTCGISRMVLNMFTESYPLDDEAAELYFLDLHAHRDVSNEVQVKFGVTHQSPQLLIIKDGAVTYHTSHGAIADMDLCEHV